MSTGSNCPGGPSESHPPFIVEDKEGMRLTVKWDQQHSDHVVTLTSTRPGRARKPFKLDGNAKMALVEFLGYPREDADQRSQTQRAREDAIKEKHVVEQKVRELEAGLEYVTGEVRTLIESLSDAWWLDAATAYRNLAEWIGPR